MIESEYNSEELLPDDDDLFLLNLDSGDTDQDPQLEGSSNPDSFPTVLHDIVSDESTDDCICWLPCGKRFQITDRKKFSKNVLSIYFGSRGTTKFTSFTRRLKRWKFNRVTKGPEMGAYYHENFVRGKPELLSKIIYPGPRKAGPTAPAPSKSSPKVKSANKARRRASTGCILQPLTDPFDAAVGSITEPTDPREKWTIESDTLDISPMPVRNKLNPSSKSPMLPKDFTAWLSETNFFDDDSGLTQNNETTSPKAQASVVSLSSQLSPPPLSNSNESFNAGAETHQPFRLATRRHSCIASIHSSSSPSYDVPLNDVSDAAKRNEGFDYTRPATTASSHIPVTKNNDTLWMTKQPQIQQQQQQPQQQVQLQQWQHWQQQQQQQQQQHHHHQQQRYEPFYQHQPQQQLLRQQQHQLLRFVSEPKDDSVPAPAPKQLEQPILNQSTTTSMPKTQKTQIHEQQQHQSQRRSSFQDETDALLRFSREFKLEDFLKDCY